LQYNEKWFVLFIIKAMDFNTSIDIIIKDLREARSIIDDFRNYQGVPELQVELAKSKCRSAEELIAFLKTVKQETRESETSEISNDVSSEVAENVTPVIKSETISQPDLFEISEEEDIEAVSASENQTTGTLKLDFSGYNKTEVDTELAGLSDTKDKPADVNIVADKFSGISSTINEQIGNIKNEEDVASHLKSRPVTNLNEAIGINDKFLYIREIFNGNQSHYTEGVSRLNQVENMADAKAVIMSYTGDSEENEAIKQLFELVKRKLASDG
jgi:hypothetical protein